MTEAVSDEPIGGYAPGNYGCVCLECSAPFMGDKRATVCRLCAVKSSRPDNSAQADAVEREARWAATASEYGLATRTNPAALAAAAETLAAVPGVVEEWTRLLRVCDDLIAGSKDPGTKADALAAVYCSRAALRALGGNTKGK